MAENKQLKGRPWLACTIIILILFTIVVTGDYFYHRERIYRGVYVAEVNLGGKQVAAARQLLAAKAAALAEQTVEFFSENQTERKDCRELGVTLAVEETMAAALSAGRQGWHLFRYPGRFRLLQKNLVINPQFRIDQTIFALSLAESFAGICWEPLNATFQLGDDRRLVTINPERTGSVPDYPATWRSLETALQSTDGMPKVPLICRPQAAEITVADLEAWQIREVVSSFTTTMTGHANRLHNIRLAAEALDQAFILPGEIFSFNETVGQTTAAAGYRAAPIIKNGKIVEGIGGGICQVSSTLYNAVLRADLTLVERRNHGLRVNYLPPGLDATVAHGSIDLKFKNHRAQPLWLRVFIDGNKLTVYLYGTKIAGQEVKVYTTDVQVISATERIIETANLAKGKRVLAVAGQPGYRATVWRSVYLAGQEVRREKISQDTYQAVPTQYYLGTAE